MKPTRSDCTPLPPGTVLPPLISPEESTRRDEQSKSPERGRSPQPKPAPRKSEHTGKRFETVNTFVDITMRGLSTRASLAWLVLWRDTKPNGLARTGVTDLARRMGSSPATAKRALAELRSRNLIEVVGRGRLGVANVYRIVAATAHDAKE